MENNYQILLGSSKSKESVVEDNFLNIVLEGNNTFIQKTEIQETIDLNEQYIKERDSCTNYRLTITINPICTNVLCNPTSTIIERNRASDGNDMLITNKSNVNEGTQMTKYIYNPIKSIGNTNVEYFMGYDIFDNVYFRTKSIRLGKYMDDTVDTPMGTKDSNGVPMPIKEYAYLKDNINGYDQAIRDNLHEHNGWIQCVNPSRIMLWKKNTDESYSLSEDSKISFIKGGNCEKTDLFPTREMLLFNTLFRYNSVGRLTNEENWSYFLSYPYKNIYDHWLVYTPKDDTSSEDYSSHGIPIIYIENLEEGNEKNPFTKSCLLFQTPYPNKLKNFNKIRFYYKGDNNESKPFIDFTVQRVVNETKFYIFKNETQEDFFSGGNLKENFKNARIKKIVNGIPCDYYIKEFRKIPNWKFENEKITPDNIIEKIKTNNQSFNSEKYNLSYGKNIFNDKIIQISFTDSVDINMLKDNLGRPITKIFLTIYKNNEHEVDWEDYFASNSSSFQPHFQDVGTKKTRYETDFQRYWSKNSVGYELVYTPTLPIENSRDDIGVLEYQKNYPNIYCMHNVKNESTDFYPDITVKYDNRYNSSILAAEKLDFKWPCPPNSIQNNIEDETEQYFYGDICEFDKSTFTETVLSKCQYRFNTVNRESSLFHDKCIVIHSIALFSSDGISSLDTHPAPNEDGQYKPATGVNTFQTGESNFFFGNDSLPFDCDNIKDNGNKMIYRALVQAGPRPEGYYYQSHYPITLKWYESELQYKSFPRIYFISDINGYIISNAGYFNIKIEKCEIGGKEFDFIQFFTHSRHRLLQNTILKLIWIHKSIEYEKGFVIKTIRTDEHKILIPYDEDLINYMRSTTSSGVEEKINNIQVYVYDYDTPLWAKHINFGRFVWRNIMSADDAAIRSREEYPFTNGNIYVHKQINFFLRRQSIGCPAMLFNRFPSDVNVAMKVNMTELYEDINEIC